MSSANTQMAKTEELIIPAPAAGLAAVYHAPAGRPAGCCVVFCHGFRGSKEGGGRAAALADKVAAMGYAAVRFDFTPVQCLSHQVDELTAVAEFCRAKIGGRLILFGRSMGGSAAVALAARDPAVAGLCLWATPHDLAETFRLSLAAGYARLAAGECISIEDEYGRLELSPAFIGDFARHDLLAGVRALAGRPILVVHGGEDEVVPLSQARELFRQAGEPKELVVIPGGDHRFLNGYPQASAALLDWLGRLFPRPGI